MGIPVSVVVSNLYMEDHEEKSIGSEPKEMKPTIWKRYVDDSFEIIKQDQRDPDTAHLNTVGPMGSIQFTDEPETDKAIPFLDMLVTRTPVGSMKVKVYRRKTLTNI